MAVKAKDLTLKTMPITLDKPRTLLYTLYGLSELQEACGSFDALMSRLNSKEPRFKDVYLLLWAGLIHEDEELRPRDVANMVHIGEMQDVLAKAMEAFMSAIPETKKNPTKAAVQPATDTQP